MSYNLPPNARSPASPSPGTMYERSLSSLSTTAHSKHTSFLSPNALRRCSTPASHATTQDMMTRLETMVLMGVELPLAAIRGQIASAIDIVIHLGRLRDRSRKVLSIQEVTGLDEKGNVTLSVLYQFQETGVVDGKITGKLEAVHSLKNCEKLKRAGIVLSS